MNGVKDNTSALQAGRISLMMGWELKSRSGLEISKFSMLPQPVCLLKLMQNLFSTSNIEGRELCRCDFIKYLLDMVLWQDACEPV